MNSYNIHTPPKKYKDFHGDRPDKIEKKNRAGSFSPCPARKKQVYSIVQLYVHVQERINVYALSYTSVRGNLAKTMNKVCDDHDPVLITRKKAAPVVMLSMEDYESLCETSYLLQSPKNAERLLASIKELNEGRGVEREIVQ
jgi:antitoxin YefM